MKSFIISLLLLASFSAQAQHKISGIVVEKNGVPIAGANVYLQNTYDGTTTNEEGKFEFSTSETGVQTLIVSFISFETFQLSQDISKMADLTITLNPDVSALGTVTISAGSFSAGDQSKVNFLKPLDIVTTASAVGDVVGALQTLPGTSINAEDGRLFVRGGDAKESLIFIDGVRVFTPYTVSANNAPVRGRYSPFLFDGVTFSTGGYSAEYGQALSSVLLLNTIDEPAETQTDIGIMSLGGSLGHTEKWKKNSLSLNAAYINLAPYTEVFPDRNEWKNPYQSFSGETVFRQQIGDGLFKIYNAFETTNFSLTQKDIVSPEGVFVDLNDKNLYSNVSFRNSYSKRWSLLAGGSYTHSRTHISLDNTAIRDVENDFHFKLKARKRFSNKFILNFGVEHFISDFSEDVINSEIAHLLGFTSKMTAAFAEADYIFSRKFAIKPGLRFEENSLSNEFTISPRFSMAYKLGKNDQISFAYGMFAQTPDKEFLKFDSDLKSQTAQHFILNYEYVASGRIFRAELFRKNYNKLISFDEGAAFLKNYANEGFGYAQGLDLFFRDNKSIRNIDYWISYSLIDTERKYLDYPIEATPTFVNKHNVSVVGKYWVDAIKSQLGISYQLASGRTYTDKNKPGFLQETSKSYNNLSFNMAYLISRQKIVYFAVSNVLGFKNNNGYQYSDTLNENGTYDSRMLTASRDQLFFVGFFWTISTDKSKNQLKNL